MESQCIFTWIGILTSAYVSFKLAAKFIHACRVYFFPTYPDFSKYGKWSVVTGSTNGIGKAIAFQLASRGQNILLISRNKSKLEVVGEEIEKKHEVQTKCLQIDFSNDEAIYDKIKECLKDLDIGTLVNNVGIAVPPIKFLDIPNLSTELRNTTRINIFSVFKMNQIVLPGMVERRRGLIVNLSSISAKFPFIYLTIYGASKAFTNYFSQALSYEYADKGITIQSCMPAFVSTNMSKNPKTNMFIRSAKDYATSHLATVDKERATHGCWQHSLQVWMMKCLPLSLLQRSFCRMVDNNRNQRVKSE